MQTLYHYSIIAGSVVTAVLALCLMLVNPPAVPEYATYRRSKFILGLGYAAYALGIAVFEIYPLRLLRPEFCPVVNLTYYFAAALLFGYSYISLLTPGYYNPRRTCRFALIYIAYVLALWTFALIARGGLLRAGILLFGLIFITQALALIRVFLSSYRRLRRQLDDNYADSTVLFIRWLNSSAWCIIIFGILCGVFAFLSPFLISLLMLAGIAVFIYIYISVQNYAFNLLPVQVVAENPVPPVEDSAPRPEFVERLQQWLAREGFRDESLTLNALAEQLGTNRSYLSAHINREYDRSFSDWVNGMRIAAAKALMQADPELPLEDVAHRCGFSSSSYFSRIFKASESITPSRWRKEL